MFTKKHNVGETGMTEDGVTSWSSVLHTMAGRTAVGPLIRCLCYTQMSLNIYFRHGDSRPPWLTACAIGGLFITCSILLLIGMHEYAHVCTYVLYLHNYSHAIMYNLCSMFSISLACQTLLAFRGVRVKWGRRSSMLDPPRLPWCKSQVGKKV